MPAAYRQPQAISPQAMQPASGETVLRRPPPPVGSVAVREPSPLPAPPRASGNLQSGATDDVGDWLSSLNQPQSPLLFVQPQSPLPFAQPQPAYPQVAQQVVIQNVIQQVTHVVVQRPRKSVAVALLLAFFFGPLGMLYSTVLGGLLLFAVNVVLAIPTLGMILLITWPIGCVWAAVAASNSG